MEVPSYWTQFFFKLVSWVDHLNFQLLVSIALVFWSTLQLHDISGVSLSTDL